jgi:hypothetical protein
MKRNEPNLNTGEGISFTPHFTLLLLGCWYLVYDIKERRVKVSVSLQQLKRCYREGTTTIGMERSRRLPFNISY